MLNRYNQKRKALEPLIAVILLIVVSVILVTIVLTWGKEFSNSSLNKTTVVFTEADSSIYMLSAGKLQNGKLIFKNISPTNKDINIIGYKINSPFQHELLNKINYLSEPKVLGPGASAIIGIVTPPEETFNVELYTADQKYVTISGVRESQPTDSFVNLVDNTYEVINLKQLSDGGYFVFGSYNILYKLNAGGQRDWNKLYSADLKNAIQTSDGKYLMFGMDYSNDGDIFITKLNSNGIEDWNAKFGGSYLEAPIQVIQTNEGGYIILGTVQHPTLNTEIWIIKINENGIEDWNKTFGGENYEYPTQVLETIDGGYLISGQTSSYGAGDSDIWLIKTDSEGEVCDYNSNNGNCAGANTFVKTFGTINPDSPRKIMKTSNGNYLFSGIKNFNKIYIANITTAGTINWEFYDNDFTDYISSGYVVDFFEQDNQYLFFITSEGSNQHILALNSTGAIDKNILFYDNMLMRSVNKSNDNYYVVLEGNTFPSIAPELDIYGCGDSTINILKINKNGDLLLNKEINELFPGTQSIIIEGNGRAVVALTSDEKLLVALSSLAFIYPEIGYIEEGRVPLIIKIDPYTELNTSSLTRSPVPHYC